MDYTTQLRFGELVRRMTDQSEETFAASDAKELRAALKPQRSRRLSIFGGVSYPKHGFSGMGNNGQSADSGEETENKTLIDTRATKTWAGNFSIWREDGRFGKSTVFIRDRFEETRMTSEDKSFDILFKNGEPTMLQRAIAMPYALELGVMEITFIRIRLVDWKKPRSK